MWNDVISTHEAETMTKAIEPDIIVMNDTGWVLFPLGVASAAFVTTVVWFALSPLLGMVAVSLLGVSLLGGLVVLGMDRLEDALLGPSIAWTVLAWIALPVVGALDWML